jgi:hypothetical protein
MSAAARSVYIFGIYLIAVGAILIGAPNTLLALLQLPATTEPWIHVAGVPVMAVGMLHVTSARSELTPFFRASVWIRFFPLIAFGALAAIGVIPPIVAGFGLVDAASAVWTRMALRQQSAAPAHV